MRRKRASQGQETLARVRSEDDGCRNGIMLRFQAAIISGSYAGCPVFCTGRRVCWPHVLFHGIRPGTHDS